jgi:hypothetical protein
MRRGIIPVPPLGAVPAPPIIAVGLRSKPKIPNGVPLAPVSGIGCEAGGACGLAVAQKSEVFRFEKQPLI